MRHRLPVSCAPGQPTIPRCIRLEMTSNLQHTVVYRPLESRTRFRHQSRQQGLLRNPCDVRRTRQSQGDGHLETPATRRFACVSTRTYHFLWRGESSSKFLPCSNRISRLFKENDRRIAKVRLRSVAAILPQTRRLAASGQKQIIRQTTRISKFSCRRGFLFVP